MRKKGMPTVPERVRKFLKESDLGTQYRWRDGDVYESKTRALANKGLPTLGRNSLSKLNQALQLFLENPNLRATKANNKKADKKFSGKEAVRQIYMFFQNLLDDGDLVKKSKAGSKQEDPNPASSKMSDDTTTLFGNAQPPRSSTESQGRGGTGGGGESKNNQARQKRPPRSANRNALSREERYQRRNERKAQAASKSDADSSSDDAGYETENPDDSNSNEDEDTTASEDESSTADQDASSTNIFTNAVSGVFSWLGSKFGISGSSDKQQNDDQSQSVQALRFLEIVDPDAPINIDEDPRDLYCLMALALLDLENKLEEEWQDKYDSDLQNEVLIRLPVRFQQEDFFVNIFPSFRRGYTGVICEADLDGNENVKVNIDQNLPVDIDRLTNLIRLCRRKVAGGQTYWVLSFGFQQMQGEQARQYKEYQELRKVRAERAERVSKEHVRRIKEELKQIEGTCPAKQMQKLRLQSLDIKLRL